MLLTEVEFRLFLYGTSLMLEVITLPSAGAELDGRVDSHRSAPTSFSRGKGEEQ